ncbi:MAG: DPP IV N-terminal domain-containing protein, partial [Gemmatimonadetes bacterium]|nr:DPP IV N-terminal domain-containing protein [Gemmatimonadota bacterium]
MRLMLGLEPRRREFATNGRIGGRDALLRLLAHATLLSLAAGLAAATPRLHAQQLTVQRIFASRDFRPDDLEQLEWLPDGKGYTFVEPGEQSGTTDLWLEHAVTGQRTKLIEGATLVPPGESGPIEIEAYQWSTARDRLLIYTRSQLVWRQPTRGYYYLYDPATKQVTPLSRAPGWQQFARFSPDGREVGFVRENNLYVVDVATGAERALTTDGSEVIINGTFDWVYEEELDLRDGWRWSPDSRRIAFWRLDQSPIETFFLIDETSLYSKPIPLRYPKAGTANSRVAIGVIGLDGGQTRWVDLGAD